MPKQGASLEFWKNPLSRAWLGAKVELTDVLWDTDGQTLVWREERQGRGALTSFCPEYGAREITPPGVSAKGGLGIEGGDFDLRHGLVVWVEEASGRLFRQEALGGPPIPLTPAFGIASSPLISSQGRCVLYIHRYEGQEALVTVDIDTGAWPIKLRQEAPCYLQAAWHKDDLLIAWTEGIDGVHPSEGCLLKLGHLEGDASKIGDEVFLAGGRQTPVFQPAFSPDGRWLSYITVEDGQDALVLYDLAESSWKTLLRYPSLRGLGRGDTSRTYGWFPESQSLLVRQNVQGISSLRRVTLASPAMEHPLDLGLVSWVRQPILGPDRRLALIASSPVQAPHLLVISTDTEASTVLRSTEIAVLSRQDLALPEPLVFPKPDGSQASTFFGLFYPPRLRPASAFSEGLTPPLILLTRERHECPFVASWQPEILALTHQGLAVLALSGPCFDGGDGNGRSSGSSGWIACVLQSLADQGLGRYETYEIWISTSHADVLGQAERLRKSLLPR